jgi:hypothetical protein
MSTPTITATTAAIHDISAPLRAAGAALDKVTASVRAAIEAHKRNLRISK